MTAYLFAAATIILLSFTSSISQPFAEAAVPQAGVNFRRHVFGLGERGLVGDDRSVAAVKLNPADLAPRDITNTVTTVVTVTVCATSPLAPGRTPLDSSPVASVTPPFTGTTSVETTPPAENPPVSSANTPVPSESVVSAPPPANPQSSETPPAVSLPPSSSMTTENPPPPENGISSPTTTIPPAEGTSRPTGPGQSSFVPGSPPSSLPSTTTAPPATSSIPPPAPNFAGHVSYDMAGAMAGVMVAALAWV